MHELSVCLSLLQTLERIAADNEASEVTSITLSLGPLSGIESELLKNAWPLAAAGTLAEKASFDVESAPVIVRCSECGRESTVAPNRLLCSHCSCYRTRVVSGDEMILQRVELSDCRGTERAN